MTDIKIISETELREIVKLDHQALVCVESAFRALAGGKVVMPPILRLDIRDHNGEVDVKTAYVPGLESFAIKVSPGFFNNPLIGLPSLNGLMILFSARTGLVKALLLDNGYLTSVRTAAAGGVAAQLLSRKNAATAAILGTGEQARLQLKALTLVRRITAVRFWGRDFGKASQVAVEMGNLLRIQARAEKDVEKAVRGADIIVSCTPAEEPILPADLLEPGQHVTAMGSDAEHKNELDPRVFQVADLYVPDSLSQVRRLGELHHAVEAGIVKQDASFQELGAVISGDAPGRVSKEQVTIADLTGTGVQDTAIATLAHGRAEEQKKGIDIEA